ncbi:hypothetical protein DL93DRAFT_2073682 [Clavulina sp. PMI_390]|nr:hypothetical protein DL93DRAFT_2073682 [Clavulina sp. PMI_390]
MVALPDNKHEPVKLDARKTSIRSVTVYKNRALVERIVKAQLTIGSNEVLIRKLPASLEKDSLRVDVLASNADADADTASAPAPVPHATLHDVTVAPAPLPAVKLKPPQNTFPPAAPAPGQALLDGLTDEQKSEHAKLARKREALTTRMNALESSAFMIRGYASAVVSSSIPAPVSDAGAALPPTLLDRLPMEKLDEFISGYPERLEGIFEKWQDAQEERDTAAKKMAALEKLAEEAREAAKKTNGVDPSSDEDDEDSDEEDVKPTGFGLFGAPAKKRKMEVLMILSAEEECEVELLVSYFIPGPTWSATYDIHANLPDSTSTSPSQVSLIYRASITQQTGEDWKDVPLKLSTAPVSSSISIPVLQPWRIASDSQKLNPPPAQLSQPPNSFTAFGSNPSTSAFGQPAQAAASGTSQGFSFGQPSKGENTSTATGKTPHTTSLFPTSNLFGSSSNNNSAGPSLFGHPGAPAAASNFGGTSSGGFGAFGSATSKPTFASAFGSAAQANSNTPANPPIAASGNNAAQTQALARLQALLAPPGSAAANQSSPSTSRSKIAELLESLSSATAQLEADLEKEDGTPTPTPSATKTGFGSFGVKQPNQSQPQPQTQPQSQQSNQAAPQSAFGASSLFGSRPASNNNTASTSNTSVANTASPQQSQGSAFGNSSPAFGQSSSPQQGFLFAGKPLGTIDGAGADSGFVASIQVEGKVSIPSDGSAHKVVIKTFKLDAEMEWVAVPRVQAAVFLQCRAKNTSDWTLVPGPSQVFFSGSFVARSVLPLVSPSETLAVSLGVDSAVRVKYHPTQLAKRVDKPGSSITPSWFSLGSSNASYPYSMTTEVKAFNSRVTVTNTRKTPLGKLILRDQIPVSEDERVKVRLISPSGEALGPLVAPLATPATASTSSGFFSSGSTSSATKDSMSEKTSEETVVQPSWATVAQGVMARWAQKSERDGGTGGSRGDGVLEWHCTDVKGAGEVEVELNWEVAAPKGLVWD